MIPAKTLHQELNRRLNRIASGIIGSFTVTDKDSAINRASRIWQRNRTRVSEKDHTVKRDLQKLFISDCKLTEGESNSYFTRFSYPDNFYKRERIYIKAKQEDCEERIIKVIMSSRNDLSNMVDDPMWDPSFEWKSTVAVDSNKSVEIYHSGKFQITGAYIDYYFEIPSVHAVDLVTSGFYINPYTGNTITQSQGLILDPEQMDMILDMAALILKADRGDFPEFQSELSKILNTEKIHLN